MLAGRAFLIAALVPAAALAVAGCPPSSDCAVTLDCVAYQAPGTAGTGGGTGGSGGLADNGAPCSAPAECASDVCIDDVCCDAACDAICQACNVEGSEGACAAVPTGSDPAGDCPGGSCDDASLCAQGNCIWSFGFGTGTSDLAYAVASDAAGAVFLGGRFGENAGDIINFGGDDLVSQGGSDIYIAKLDARGAEEWSFSFGDLASQVIYGVRSDSTGAAVFTGIFRGTVDFDGDPLTSTMATTYDMFIAKFEGDGTPAWSERYGDTADDFSYAVAVDPSDNIAIAGEFQGTINFPDGARTAEGTDMFVAKLESDGDFVWSRDFGDPQDQVAHAVATDPSGAVVFGGSLDGSANFGGSTLTSTMSSVDAVIVKLNADASHAWSHRYGDQAEQLVLGIATGPDGSVVATGTLEGALDADGTVLDSMGLRDAFIMKLDADGNVVWAKRFGDDSDQVGDDVAIDASGNVILVGRFEGTIEFGGAPLLSAGSNDVFVAKFAPDGTHLYSHRYGDNNSSQIVSAVGVDPSGAALIAGRFTGALDFGMGALTIHGDTDAFVAKLSP